MTRDERARQLYQAELKRTHGRPSLLGVCRIAAKLSLEEGADVSTEAHERAWAEASARGLFGPAYEQSPHMHLAWHSLLRRALKLELAALKRGGKGGQFSAAGAKEPRKLGLRATPRNF